MRRAGTGALAAVLAASACSSPTPLASEAPDSIRWLALVQLDTDDSVQRASALSRWDGDSISVFASDTRDALVLGYTDEQLQQVAPGVSPSAIADEPLQRVSACAPALPAPAWIGRWSTDGRISTAADASVPSLGASWLDASCTPLEDLWVDSTCAEVRCPVSAERRGCTWDLDLASCGLGAPRVVANRAALCVDFGAEFACAPTPAPSLAAAASSCTGPSGPCTLTWYRQAQPLGVEVRTLELPRAGPWRPVRAEIPGPLPHDILRRGHAWTMATVGRDALVSAPVEVREVCDGDALGELHLIDGDRFAHTRTATAPACLLELVGDGDTAVGVFAEASQWWLGRFDAQGRRVAFAAADPRPFGLHDPPRPDVSGWSPSGLARGPSGWTAIWRARLGRDSLVTSYDEALAPRTRLSIPERVASGVAYLDASTVAVVTDDSGEVLVVDVAATGELRRRTRIDARSGRPAQTLYAPTRSGNALLIASGTPPAVFVLGASTGTVLGEALIYDADAAPLALRTVPWDPLRTLAFGSTPQRTATMTAFSPTDPRFLPGTQPLGDSVPSVVASDTAQRIWVLMAWTGQVALLEATP